MNVPVEEEELPKAKEGEFITEVPFVNPPEPAVNMLVVGHDSKEEHDTEAPSAKPIEVAINMPVIEKEGNSVNEELSTNSPFLKPPELAINMPGDLNTVSPFIKPPELVTNMPSGKNEGHDIKEGQSPETRIQHEVKNWQSHLDYLGRPQPSLNNLSAEEQAFVWQEYAKELQKSQSLLSQAQSGATLSDPTHSRQTSDQHRCHSGRNDDQCNSDSGKNGGDGRGNFTYTRMFVMGFLIMLPFAFISLFLQYDKLFTNESINQPAHVIPAYGYNLIWAFCILMMGLSNVFSFKAQRRTNTGNYLRIFKAIFCREIIFTYIQLMVLIGWSVLFFDQLRFFSSAILILCALVPLAFIKMFMLLSNDMFYAAMCWTPYFIWLWMVFALNWAFFQANS